MNAPGLISAAPAAPKAPATPSPPELSDEALARRIVGGEKELFELLMRRHNQRLYRAARAILKSDDEAEDVMQDAYVRAYTHLREFSGAATFGGWLTRIAVNEALARLRRRKRFDSLDGNDDHRSGGPGGEGVMATDDRSPEEGARCNSASS